MSLAGQVKNAKTKCTRISSRGVPAPENPFAVVLTAVFVTCYKWTHAVTDGTVVDRSFAGFLFHDDR